MFDCYSFSRQNLRLIVSILPLLLFFGCGESKTAQCQKLILITQAMAETASEHRNSLDPKQMLAIADDFEKSAQKLEKLSLENPELRSYQQTLTQIYSDNAAVTRIMIRALEDQDIPTAKSAQEKVKAVGEQERTVITQMNQACQVNDG